MNKKRLEINNDTKIIKIDLIDKEDLYEKYNKDNVSKELINYIIEQAIKIRKKDKIKLVINNKVNEKVSPLIKEGLEKEYEKCTFRHYNYNVIQIVYLIVGIITLFISTLIDGVVFKEVVLIGGWVLIWTMMELEMSTDIQNSRKRKIIKKLLNSEIIEK